MLCNCDLSIYESCLFSLAFFSNIAFAHSFVQKGIVQSKRNAKCYNMWSSYSKITPFLFFTLMSIVCKIACEPIYIYIRTIRDEFVLSSKIAHLWLNNDGNYCISPYFAPDRSDLISNQLTNLTHLNQCQRSEKKNAKQNIRNYFEKILWKNLKCDCRLIHFFCSPFDVIILTVSLSFISVMKE